MSDIHPDIAKLVAAGKLPPHAAVKLTQLHPGVFCQHKSWGVGRIGSWELFDDKVVIDFEDKKGHPMKLEFAANSLNIVEESHILARRYADPASLSKLAAEDPVGLVREILQSHGGSMLLDSFEGVVKPKIVGESKFKNWWESVKKLLKTKPEFIVPSKRTIPLELRGGNLSPAEALVQDFRKARGIKAKAKAMEAIARDASVFTNREELESLLKEADDAATQNLRLHTVEAVDLILARDELRDKVPGLHDAVSPALAAAMKTDGPRLAECVGSLAVSKQRRVFDALVDATGDSGVESLLPLLNKLSARSINELCSVLKDKGYTGPMNGFLKTGILHRTLASETLVWIIRERAGLSADVFGPELSRALLSAIERDHFDDENRKANRINDVLVADRELISDLITGVELPQVRIFARQLLLTPAIDEMGKRSLLARFIRVYPEIETLIREGQKDEKEEEAALIVSWKSLDEKKKAFDHLINVEIPKNVEDISIARSYGDLRENFEFKSAKEYAVVLQRRKFEMERDLQRAQGTGFEDAATDKVTIGTRVTLLDLENGQQEEFSILGAWDTDVPRHIISYLSVTAAAILNKAVGDEVDLPNEDGNTTRRVKITAIELAKVPELVKAPESTGAASE
ncbi:MAG TPA: GreA/GreB family elongation factor [Verrucomicrobiales bacterium]|jgi:transcription elongation GreA/GreB family factor|nr:GreA/GreB family elongation factor [Verrucomicrobiales bacterium]